jgi:hypothetical protein
MAPKNQDRRVVANNTPPRAKKPVSEAESSAATPSSKSPRDVVLIHGLTEDKKGLRVLRARQDSVEAGEVRPLVEGQPINSDVVRLKPRAGTPFLCDVETELAIGSAPPSAQLSSRSGPAQVANRAYRDNWDAIWARPAASQDPSKLN